MAPLTNGIPHKVIGFWQEQDSAHSSLVALSWPSNPLPAKSFT